MKTVTSNQKVVPQTVATLDKSLVRYGAYMLPASLVKVADPKTKDTGAVRYGAYMSPQGCRR